MTVIYCTVCSQATRPRLCRLAFRAGNNGRKFFLSQDILHILSVTAV